MKFGTMLKDVVRALFRSPVTRLYPAERQPTPARLRGKLRWTRDQCTGCGLCVTDCPSDALELITLERAAKRFVLRYDVGRCTFCSQCVQNCRFNCLEMLSDDWELAAADKTPFVIYYGSEEDVAAHLDRPGEGGSGSDKDRASAVSLDGRGTGTARR